MDAKAAACLGMDRPEGGVRPAKLFIGGITRHTTTKQLRDHFSRYGRVLDCVAMRQPDGRPRGFGYVTLDSPAAADRCLAEPQVIDGRVVDMKRAVPEGSGVASSPSAAAMGQHTDFCMGMRTPHSPLYAWPDSPGSFFGGAHLGGAFADASPSGLADHLWSWSGTPVQKGANEVLDCVELLSRRAAKIGGMVGREAPSPLAEPATPTSPEGGARTHPRAGVLSANAPEFVPASWQEPVVVQSVTSPVAAQPKRAPLGELTNITNIMNISKNSKDASKADAIKERPTPAPIAIGRLSGSTGLGVLGGAESPAAGARKPMLLKEGMRSMMEIREDTSEEDQESDGRGEAAGEDSSDEGSDDENAEDEACSPMGSDEAGELSPHTPGYVSVQNLGPLPSMGSVEHAQGTCKRCNFFPKGRCQNGANCTFCHYPHDKRKPSRQEKRDRRAARLCMREAVEGGALDDPMRSLFAGDQENLDESMEGDDTTQRTLAYTMLPGMPPIGSVQLPAPLALPGNGSYSSTTTGFPCLPPGLPPPKCGLEMWQPDEEVSPLRFCGPSPTSRSAQSVLATVPMGPSTPQSVAATSPTADSAAAKEMCTIGTQTFEDLDCPCPRCCDAEPPACDENESGGEGRAKTAAKATAVTTKARRGRTWHREELLRVRGAMESTGVLPAKGAAGKASLGAAESS